MRSIGCDVELLSVARAAAGQRRADSEADGDGDDGKPGGGPHVWHHAVLSTGRRAGRRGAGLRGGHRHDRFHRLHLRPLDHGDLVHAGHRGLAPHCAPG
eukprot:scaffold207156_cov30-Tisochrysis_lutea.AAC.1